MRLAIEEPSAAEARLVRAPALASARLARGAGREDARDFFFDAITHYVYAGDTALHLAAAAYRPELARALLARGADVRAKNRRGAEPLHYAADGHAASRGWDPARQAEVITTLIEAGADPNAIDASGVAPLHRAVRTGCSAAVRALLAGGADAAKPNKNGSTARKLATVATGRGGSGSSAAKAERDAILRVLDEHARRG